MRIRKTRAAVNRWLQEWNYDTLLQSVPPTFGNVYPYDHWRFFEGWEWDPI